MTRLLSISPTHPDPQAIEEAARVIRAGGLVAFPTETVYGLGASALDPAAVQKIFAAKERPASDPLIVHIAAGDLARVVPIDTLPPDRAALMRAVEAHVWPGPLTLVVPRGAAVPPAVSAGRATVAVRMPRHPVAAQLIVAARTPIAAPSANRFGHTSPTTGQHVLADLDGRIDLVLDAGPTAIGLESTVLDLTSDPPTVLRPGAWTAEALAQALNCRVVWQEHHIAEHSLPPGEGLAGPGMLERHYAPTADLWLYIGEPEAARGWLQQQIAALHGAGRQVGLLVCDDDADLLAAEHVDIERLGPAADLNQIGNRLYAALRQLDARQPDIILARDFGGRGLALAIRDRLRRAARKVEQQA